jgi:hypothetical protein
MCIQLSVLERPTLSKISFPITYIFFDLDIPKHQILCSDDFQINNTHFYINIQFCDEFL